MQRKRPSAWRGPCRAQAIRRELQEALGYEAPTTSGRLAPGAAPERAAAASAAQALSRQPLSALLPAALGLATNRRSRASCCVAEATRLRVQSLDVRFAAARLQLWVDARGGEGGKVGAWFGGWGGREAAEQCLRGGASAGQAWLARAASAPVEPAAAGVEACARLHALCARVQVTIPKGCILALCPYESHHDDDLYPNAAAFDPARPPLSLGASGAAVVPPSVAGALAQQWCSSVLAHVRRCTLPHT